MTDDASPRTKRSATRSEPISITRSRRGRRWLRQDHGARRSGVRLLIQAGVDVRNIAAITFTEKAAAELRVACEKSSRSGRRRRALQCWRCSAARRCRRCTRSLVGCSPSTASSLGCRRVLSCSTRSARPSISRSAGVPSPRSCSNPTAPSRRSCDAEWNRGSRGPASEARWSRGTRDDRLRDAPRRGSGLRLAGTCSPSTISPFLSAIPKVELTDEVLADYIARARVTNSDEACIDVLRTERVTAG